MENFEQFELANLEMIYGGRHVPTQYTTSCGCGVGSDIYDTEKKAVVYF